MAHGEFETELASKASWDLESTRIFCDVCLKEVEIGNRPGSHFNKTGWENITSEFAKATGKKYEKLQLKNKWDQLKKDWKLWKQLMQGETGLGWDQKKRTVHASEDWWKEKIKRFPEAKKFKKLGIDPEFEDKLDAMFSNITARGNESFAPTSGEFPSDVLDSHGDCDSEFSDDNAAATLSNNKKRVSLPNSNSIKKKAKLTGAEKLSLQIDRLVGSLGERKKPSVSTKRSQCSITEAVELLNLMEKEVPRNSELYYFATKLLLDKDKREMFIALQEDSRVWWLKKEQSESQK